MRFLHTMVRVADLDRALAFYVDTFGLTEVRRVDNQKGRFTLVFVVQNTTYSFSWTSRPREKC